MRKEHTEDGKKRLVENINSSENTKWGKELRNQKRTAGDSGKQLITEWQRGQQLQDCYLPAAVCLAFSAFGAEIVFTWKHWWCVLAPDPAPYISGNSYWWGSGLWKKSTNSSPAAFPSACEQPHKSTSNQTCCTQAQDFLVRTVRNSFYRKWKII